MARKTVRLFSSHQPRIGNKQQPSWVKVVRVLFLVQVLLDATVGGRNGKKFQHYYSCQALSSAGSGRTTSSTKQPPQPRMLNTKNNKNKKEEYGNYPVHTLVLCRHGDSIWNGGEPGCRETFTGWSDVPLSAKGIREARALGAQLRSQTQRMDVCCTSLLQRAQMTAHYCLWEGLLAVDPSVSMGTASSSQQQHPPPLYVTDYRLNERHYGRLQGYVKEDVERGRILNYTSTQVRAWRRSWHAVPPLLLDDDDHGERRRAEVVRFQHACGGAHNIPRGESLAMVARDRIQPFLDETLTPLLRDVSRQRQQLQRGDDGATTNKETTTTTTTTPIQGGTALIVAHANSLRALIGTLCRVTDDPRPGAAALRKLEALQLPTGVPLVLFYQETDTAGHYRVCDIMPQQEQQEQPQEFASSSTTTDLPVWPLRSLPSLDYSYYYHARATSGSSTATTKTINPLTVPVAAPTRKPKLREHYDVYLLVQVVVLKKRETKDYQVKTNDLFLVGASLF